jgi:hypothetical protein
LRIFAGFLLSLLIVVSPSVAGPIAIQNPSFENPLCGSPGSACGPVGWTISGGFAGAFLPTSAAWDSIPDGSQVAWSNGGTLTQALADSILPDTVYTLSVWVSQRWSAGSFLPQIELLGGDTPLFAMNNSNAGGSAPTTNTDGTYGWVNWTMSWTSPSSGAIIGQPLAISLGSSGTQTDFDSVSLDVFAAVPEPSAIVLVAAGLLGLAARRRFAK